MTTTQDNYSLFYAAESTLSGPPVLTQLNGRSIYRFNPQHNESGKVPLHVRTGAMTFGAPHERKRFRAIEFHGSGTIYVRVYVDGTWISDGSVTMSESPSKNRRMGLPIGTTGYAVDVEFCGDANIRAVEFDITGLSGAS